jgi:transketolase
MTDAQAAQLTQLSASIRRDILDMLYRAGSGHPGGSMSAVELLVYLYMRRLRIDPARPNWLERDRFIASKGHCAPALYAVLARRGFFPRKALWTLRAYGSMLQGHPDMRKVPGIELSTGSLGMGLSAGLGMALGARLDGLDSRAYVLLGDGELDEGQNWEAAMAAAKFKTGNLIAVVDANGMQLDGAVEEIMPLGSIGGKFAAFGWRFLTADGHDFLSLDRAFAEVEDGDVPTVIIAKTVKGKGVAMMEGKSEWHGKPLTEDLYAQAVSQLAQAGGEKGL